MTRKEEAGRSDVLGEEVRRDVAGALVLHCNLLGLKLVANVVDFQSNMRRFGRDSWGTSEFDGGVVVFQHD